MYRFPCLLRWFWSILRKDPQNVARFINRSTSYGSINKRSHRLHEYGLRLQSSWFDAVVAKVPGELGKLECTVALSD